MLSTCIDDVKNTRKFQRTNYLVFETKIIYNCSGIFKLSVNLFCLCHCYHIYRINYPKTGARERERDRDLEIESHRHTYILLSSSHI